MANDLNELGAAGDASKATAAKGEACADYGVEGFIELLRDVAAFDLATSATVRSAASSGPALVAVDRAHGDLPAR